MALAVVESSDVSRSQSSPAPRPGTIRPRSGRDFEGQRDSRKRANARAGGAGVHGQVGPGLPEELPGSAVAVSFQKVKPDKAIQTLEPSTFKVFGGHMLL